MKKTNLWSSKTEGTNKQYQEWKGAHRFNRGFIFKKSWELYKWIYALKFETADENITTKTDLKKKQTPYTIQKLNL